MSNTKPHSSRHPLWQRRWRQTVTIAAALALAATVGPVASQPQAEAADLNVTVTIDGDDIRADNVNGLTFKGFGVLSANSTSAVLMDYKAQQPEAYAELLQTLFGGSNPIMDHVKIEMGNDRNTSTGPNPATMRTLDEEANPLRDPGFQLAADAKKINPDLKVSILRWREPYFASSSNGNNATTYTWFKNTVLAAYREYGYMVDYLNPGRNETAVSWSHVTNFVNWMQNDTAGYISDDPALAGFQSPEEEALYKSIKIIVDDSSGLSGFGGTLKSNTTYQSLIDVVGYHYTTDDDSGGNFKWWADTYDGEVWNSEAQATFSNSAFRPNSNTVDKDVSSTARQSPGIGGLNSALEMANTIVKGYVNSRRTHFIYQPAIGSFYEGGQYSYKELVSARDPWSGWTHYDAGLLVLEHFTDFAVTGWENEDNTAGIWRGVTSASVTTASGTNPIKGRDGGANHMTLAAPDKTAFSTIVVNDSEYAKTYTFNLANMNIAADASLEVWETRAADTAAGQAFNANYKKHVADVAPGDDGSYTVSVKPWSIITVTSLDKSGDAEVLEPLPVEGERTVLDIEEDGDGVLWQDDFEYGDKTVPVFDSNGEPTAATESFIDSRGGPTGADALYTWDRQGAFEAYLDGDNYVLRQQVDQQALGGLGSAWNGGDPITGIGDYRWVNYKVSVDVRFDSDNTSNYAAVGARSTGGDNSQNLSATPYALRLGRNGNWYLQRFGSTVASGTMTTASGVWYNLALTVAGNKITAAIDGAEVAAYTDASPVLAGRVDLASGFYYTSFDNLLVEKLEAYVPYYSERLDSLETHDLASPPNTKLVYTGDWYHRNGEGMYNYQRSLSSSAGVGASVAYTFTGTGFDIMANNSSSATLQLTIDGHKVSSAEKNWPTSAYWRTSYSLRGLPLAQHTVELEVLAGTLVIDSFDTVAGPVADPESIDLTPVTDALAATADVIKTENFSDAQWAAFQAMRAHAAAAAADSAAYGLDAEGPVEIAARLGATALPGAWVLPAVSTATWKGQAPELPTTLEATEADEGITSTFPITWDLDGVSFNTAWSTVTVTGRYQHLETTATVEVVPEGLVYFADLNGVASGLGAGTSALGYTSPAYLAIAGLADSAGQPLLNDKPDQVYSAESGWGHQAYQSNGTTSSIAYKGVVAGAYDKATTTGIYSGQNSTGALTTYTFSLPAGSYALAFMSYSWWASSSRTTQVYIDYGATRSTTVLDTFTLSTSANTSGYLGAFPVDLESAGEVTLRLRATNAQAPMLSWAAVYQVIPTAVAVNPAVATVAPGRAAPFTGTVTLSTGATNTDVDWSVTGATSADTSITDGVLSLGLDEPAGTVLTVTAAAAADPGKTASATVTVAVDKSELTALAAEAGVLEEDFYTADSWAGLAPVLVEAADVIGDLDATQAAVDGALAALQSAVEGLELKVVGLEVVAPPTRTVYVASPDGGELDLDGLAVRFVHADQSTSAVLAAGAYEVSGFSLAEPGAQEVTVSAGAQGQVFEAGFEIVVNSPELSLGVVVSIRCVSGKAYLGVQVTNTDTVPADLVLTSQFGSKAFSVVAVGKKATHNFTTALASIGDGSVSVRGVGSGGGAAAPVADRSVGYVPASCAS